MIPNTIFVSLLLALGFVSAALAQEESGETPPTTAPTSFSGKTIDQMTADEVLRLVRFSYTLYNRDFTGALRMGVTKKVDFLLSLKPESIRFIFDDPAQIIYIDTKNQKFSLFEGVAGKEMAPVSPSKYGEAIRGTDVTYDDLSMRFLYWPDAKIVKEERIKARECILARVRNPDGAGSYSTVDIWIDKQSGGMLKMMGYDRSGRPIRRFEVLHGKKFGDVWMVDEMRIETINPGSGQIDSSTRMKINSAAD